mgnify:CR=1 FL=1
MKFHERLADLRRKNKLTQRRVADYLGISRGAYANYETGAREPDAESLTKLADLFGITLDTLLGRTDDPSPPENESKPYYALTEKDKRDIAKDLERMMSDLESNEAMAFYGEPMDEETKRLIRISLEHSMRLGKEMAKKKFTPKKYRKDD